MAFLARCPECGHFQVCVFELDSNVRLKCQSCRADFSPAYEDSPAAQDVNWSLAMTMCGHEYEPPRRSSENLVVIADLPSVYPKKHYPRRRRKHRRVHVELPRDIPRPTPDALAADVLLQPTEEAKHDPTAPQAEPPVIVEWSEEMSPGPPPQQIPPTVKPRPARKPKVVEDIEYGRLQLNAVAILALFLLVAGLLASSLTSWGIVSLVLVGASVIVGALAVRSSLREGRRLLVPVTTLGVGAVVLVISLTTPGIFGTGAAGNHAPPFADTALVIPHPQFASDPSVHANEWVDASKASLQLGGTRVEIVEVRSSTSLLIRVRLFRDTAIPGSPTESKTLIWNPQVPAVLWDASGNRHEQQAANQEGSPANTDVRPGIEVIDVVLTFPMPAGNSGSFHLELAAKAWGSMGTLKFAIPRSMVRR